MLKNKVFLKACFSLTFCFICVASYGETCSNIGNIQYKANGTCDTAQRTCCEYGEYSEWDRSCKEACPSSCNNGYTRTDKEYGYYSECCQCANPKKLITVREPGTGNVVFLCVCSNSDNESSCTSNGGTWSSDVCSCTCNNTSQQKNCTLEGVYTDNQNRPGTWNPNTCSCTCPNDSTLADGKCLCNGSSKWNSAQKKCVCNLSRCIGSGATLDSDKCVCNCPDGYKHKDSNSTQFRRRKCDNGIVVTFWDSIVKGCHKACFVNSTWGGYFVSYPNDCKDSPMDYCVHTGGTPQCRVNNYIECTYP